MTKQQRISLLLLPLGILLLTGFSCAKKAAEEATEKAIEKATNNQADVDLGTNSITINTKQGSFQAGDEVKLPPNFPSDVFVYTGTLKAATTTTENQGYSVSVETNDSVAAVQKKYRDQLASDGWTISIDASYGDSAAVGGQKGKRTVTVSIAKGSEGKTAVAVITATSTSTNPY